MEVEFEARRFGRFQLDPLLQFAELFFPWTVLLVATLLNVRRGLGGIGLREVYRYSNHLGVRKLPSPPTTIFPPANCVPL